MIEPSDPYHVIPHGVETRWASPENPSGEPGAGGGANGGRKGSACFPLRSGDERVLAQATRTSGTLRRIWVTISDRSPEMLRGVRFEIFWDGAQTPSVSAPLGDFFGLGLGRMARFESALFASPEGRSFSCFVPMPFRQGMKVTVVNETARDLDMFFYDVNYTVGDRHGPQTAWFHSHWRRERPTTLGEDYEFLPRVDGRGRLLGVNMGVIADRERYSTSWWGEGEVKVWIDRAGERPTLCGTGTEDYIGTGWGQGRFSHLYSGCPLADADAMQYSFYRYHVPDPIWFQESIRATIQQIGCWSPETRHDLHDSAEPILAAEPGPRTLDLSTGGEAGEYGLFERSDDWSSCAYFYLDRPENDLPPLPGVETRTARLYDGTVKKDGEE